MLSFAEMIFDNFTRKIERKLDEIDPQPCRDKQCPYLGEHNLDDHDFMDKIEAEEAHRR